MSPLAYLTASGERAQTILPLTWLTLVISVVVCVVIAILLWGGVRRALVSGGAAETRAGTVERGRNGLRWIGVGLAISGVPLIVTLLWTMVALARISGPPAGTRLALDVSAHQWWWEVRYDSSDPSQSFATANEIHIPTGVPVLIRLHGSDVIHSFWVPQLSGKTDTIPGQTNTTWLQAPAPGIFRGQCSEYCGPQHAHMAFEVIAESPADFESWRAHQLQTAPEPQTEQQTRGRELVEYRCGLCHKVGGTTAGAIAAPDLTHLMSRGTIGAGTLPNGPGTLAAWIQGSELLKPGTLMPNQDLPADQLVDVLAYLETLK